MSHRSKVLHLDNLLLSFFYTMLLASIFASLHFIVTRGTFKNSKLAKAHSSKEG